MRYCVRVNPDFSWYSLQQWVFDTSLQKIANVIPTAAFKQSAKVLGPLVKDKGIILHHRLDTFFLLLLQEELIAGHLRTAETELNRSNLERAKIKDRLLQQENTAKLLVEQLIECQSKLEDTLELITWHTTTIEEQGTRINQLQEAVNK